MSVNGFFVAYGIVLVLLCGVLGYFLCVDTAKYFQIKKQCCLLPYSKAKEIAEYKRLLNAKRMMLGAMATMLMCCIYAVVDCAVNWI